MSYIFIWRQKIENRSILATARSIFRFLGVYYFQPKNWSLKRAELRKTRLSARRSKNRKKFIFELGVFYRVKFAADHDASIKIMFPTCFGVEKRILLRPDFFLNGKSCVFWKRTLQRLAYISKLGFWDSNQGPKVAGCISKSAKNIFSTFYQKLHIYHRNISL